MSQNDEWTAFITSAMQGERVARAEHGEISSGDRLGFCADCRRAGEDVHPPGS